MAERATARSSDPRLRRQASDARKVGGRPAYGRSERANCRATWRQFVHVLIERSRRYTRTASVRHVDWAVERRAIEQQVQLWTSPESRESCDLWKYIGAPTRVARIGPR